MRMNEVRSVLVLDPGRKRPVRTSARRAWTYRQLHGIRATIRAVWRLYVYSRRRIVILTADLAGPPPDPPPDGITFRRATEDDLAALPTLRAFVSEAQWLHVARDGDWIVAFRRVARSFPHGSGLSEIIPPQPNRIFTQETFVRPDYRGQSLGFRLSIAQDRYLAQVAGAREIVTAVDADNVPSLRMNLRKGARPLCFVESFRCLLYHRTTASPTMPPEVQHLMREVTGEPG